MSKVVFYLDISWLKNIHIPQSSYSLYPFCIKVALFLFANCTMSSLRSQLTILKPLLMKRAESVLKTKYYIIIINNGEILRLM